MNVNVLKECGYEEAVVGFSLSYNSTIERTKEILPKYAFGIPGENKFLEQIYLWVDITAPRFFWQEFSTYRVGTTSQSESTMHTVTKHPLTQENFETEIEQPVLSILNKYIKNYKNSDYAHRKNYFFTMLKNSLPEGFLQRRIVTLNYKSLQNIYNQRKDHKLFQWHSFLEKVLEEIEHPEFIIKLHRDIDF